MALSRPVLIIGSVTVLVIATAIAGVLVSTRIQQLIFDRAARQRMAQFNAAPFRDDALRLATCGTSAPLPSRQRAKACVAVFAGGKIYIVDSGPESTENLMLWSVPLARVEAVLLTHFHSDHIGDLGELQMQSWAAGRGAPLQVYGGPGVECVVAGFNHAYRQDQAYRTLHHGEQLMPSRAWGMVARPIKLAGPGTTAIDRSGVVLVSGQLKVTAIEVDHGPVAPAYAYRFDYKGRSAVITGDFKHHPPLIRHAAGADLFITEALSRTMIRSIERAANSAGRPRIAQIMNDVQDYHISATEAADIANRAKVKLVVYYHLGPSPDGFLARRLFANGVDEVRSGEWAIAEDGDLFTLPIGSTEIRQERIGE